MAESSMKKAGDIIKKDRISELPRNVQETILCFLPIEEAVRTSILSKNWRHCWTMMPHLIFDGGFYERMVDKLGYHSCTELMAYRCVSVINKTILLHRGPVVKFSVSIPPNECDAQIFHDYIDQWIPVLSSKGVKELMLEDLELQEVTAHHFSSLDLTYLRLLSVWFPYKPNFGRFAYLTNLELVDATSHFGQDVFDCPVLEKLTLILCPGLYHSNFRAPNLSCLRQIYREINSEIPYVGLDNLKDYSFMLLQPGPLLAKTSNVVKYLGGLHKIEKFSIAREFVQDATRTLRSNRMAESSVRKIGRIEKDRISELPQNVRATILCFMPIQDAVRTSILSKKWRYCWTMMPHLIFDEKFVDGIWGKLGYVDDDDLMAYKFVSRINKIILLHKGPILKFSLYIPHYNCDAQIVHDFIDQWIPLLSVKGTKEVILEDYDCRHAMAHHFSSLDLTHLRLLGVGFHYKPTFGRFTHLKNLKLVEAHYHESYRFKQNIFDCPVLEKLSLILCYGLFHTNFHAPNLNCLHQVYRVATPEIPYAGLENLTEYSFLLYRLGMLKESKTSNVVKYLGSLHKIEKFSIARYSLKAKDCESDEDCDDEDCYGEKDLKNYQIEDSEGFTTTGHLQIVSFSYFRGLKAELELVKFVLAHSPLLKTMFIHRDVSIGSGVALKMTEEMLQYPRASTIAQIKHLECGVKIDAFDYELLSGMGYS
ncbi:hypothetical protein ACET3Z_014030 [Daucus carota]